ncbi:MAG: hypothetical protein H6739_27220 [Alphaproteobacteria bacterium]|nr:hypothetical protein [Alphaproteobacteria bacterium]
MRCPLLVTFLVLGCHGDAPTDSAPLDVQHRLDDVLTVADLQAVGTHNSFHVQTLGHPEWQYTHRPLDEQLGEVGVRQFELDVWWSEDRDDYDVFHIALIDQGTTCETLADCACTMWSWSEQHPGHHPILTLLEVGDVVPDTPEEALTRLDTMEQDLLTCWPRDRLLTPDDVQRGHASLADAVAAEGWPTLGETRGTAMWVLHTGAEWRHLYTQGDTTTAGRLIFPDGGGDTANPVAVFHAMNDPWDPRIPDVVGLGHLVRTRTDSGGEQARANDTTQAEQALASGAHFVSTDFPEPHPETGYVVRIPDGQPSRCNPLRAVEGCQPTDIEDPALLTGR